MQSFVDANVPMYAAGGPSSFKEPCAAIITAISDGNLRAVSDTEVLQEIVYRYQSIGQPSAGLAMGRRFAAILSPLLPVDYTDALLMMDLLEQLPRLSPRDALHIAVMRRHGISHIITADSHFAQVSGIVRLDPRTALEQLR